MMKPKVFGIRIQHATGGQWVGFHKQAMKSFLIAFANLLYCFNRIGSSQANNRSRF